MSAQNTFSESYALNLIEKCIRNIGGRAPGSSEESQCATLIVEELKKYCDYGYIEPFNVHPDAFLGYIPIVLILYLIGLFIWPYLPIFSFLMAIIAFVVFYKEFFQYAEFIDPLFPEKKSQNVIGEFNVSDNYRNIVIVAGHHDSAYEFQLLAKSPYLYILSIISGMVSLTLFLFMTTFWTFLISLSILGQIQTTFFLSLISTIWYILLIMLPLVLPLFFFKSSRAVPGAVDNLSAVSVVISVARTLRTLIENGFKLENTRVMCISFGSEEAGLRGYRRFVEKHLNELKSKKTYVLNMDTLADPRNLCVVVEEKTTRTKHSRKLIDALTKIAEELQIPLNMISLPSFGGGTDAAPFSWVGIDATTFFGVELSLKTFSFYHTMRDTPDKINPRVLRLTHDIIIEFIKNLEKEESEL